MLKRLIDITFSLIGLIVLLPVIAVIGLLIRHKLGSPILFRQTRPGLDGKPFQMIKFRTMRDANDENDRPLPDSARITPFGRFLRSTSLDELPELWNVVKGDMSIVGPRPLLMEYLEYYTEEEMLRHSVRPGITGLAQVTGRNNTKWDLRLQLDVYYVKNRTLRLDIQIILKTIKQVFMRDGVVAVPSEAYQKLSEERKN